MEFVDPSGINKSPNLTNITAPTPAFSSFATGDSISYICGICKLEFCLNNPEDQVKMLGCGHTFCPECFANFF